MRSLWRKLLIGIGIAAIARGGFLLAVHSLESNQRAIIAGRTEALKASYDARDYRRPVLRGEPILGDAWDHYLPALEELDGVDKFKNDYVHLLSDYSRGKPTDVAAVESILEKYGPVLHRLRAGAQCASARFTYDWTIQVEPGIEFGDPRFRYDWKKDWDFREPHLASQSVSLLSRSMSRKLREQGRFMEAAELMLDLCVFSRDRDQSATRPFYCGSGSFLEELKDIVTSGRLSRSELQRLDDELEILAGMRANPAHALWNAVLKLGMDFCEEAHARRQLRFGDVNPGWRDLFSYELLHARAFHGQDLWTSSLTAARRANAPEERRIEREVWIQEQAAGYLPGVYLSYGQSERREAAKVKLLRMAVHYLATGKVMDSPDPFGAGMMKWTLEGVPKFWSVGPDGLDQVGKGGDIVLEFPR